MGGGFIVCVHAESTAMPMIIIPVRKIRCVIKVDDTLISWIEASECVKNDSHQSNESIEYQSEEKKE
jgi:hypothetical protein